MVRVYWDTIKQIQFTKTFQPQSWSKVIHAIFIIIIINEFSRCLEEARGLDSSLGHLGSLLSLLELLLSLAELGQVQGSNLLGLLNLLLVGLDLLLQLAGKLGHLFLALPVLILGESQLLTLALSTLVGLHVLRSARLDVAKLTLKLTDPHLKLGHGCLSSLHGSSLGIRQAAFKVSELSLKRLLCGGLTSGMILLGTELIGKASSVDHSLLGLLFGILGSSKHSINLGLNSVDVALKSTLSSHFSAIDSLHFIASISGISNFHVQLALGSLSRVKKGLALLNLSREGSSLAVSNSNSLNNLSTLASLILIGLDGFPQLALVTLDGLQTFSISLVGMVKSNLKLIDVTLKLLLDAKSFSLLSLLSFQGSSQRFHGALVVLTGIVELLLLLSNSSVNLLADLAELKLRSQDLILLLLKSTFSFLKSSLEFFLLLLKTSALLVQVMDRAASTSKLVKKILDFISKVLVLTPANGKLSTSLILSRLQAEEL